MKKYALVVFLLSTCLIGFVCFLGQDGNEEVLQEKKLIYQYRQSIDWSKAGVDARRYQIDYQQVIDAVTNGAKLYDTRDIVSYQLGHFEFAENLPLMNLEVSQFPDLDKETPIYIYCKTSVCSAKAAKLFRQEGFQHVYDLGGLEQLEVIGGQLD